MIEIGRFKKISVDQRFCPFCVEKVESEIHFLIHCPLYEQTRAVTFEGVEKKVPGFTFYTDVQKFQYLLSEECPEIPEMIEKCMEFRKQLLKSLGGVGAREWMYFLLNIFYHLSAILMAFCISLVKFF